MIGGHWGASGVHEVIVPRASGRSVTILGNVGRSSEVEDIRETVQQSKR